MGYVTKIKRTLLSPFFEVRVVQEMTQTLYIFAAVLGCPTEVRKSLLVKTACTYFGHRIQRT